VNAPMRAVLERCAPETRQEILRATAEAAVPYSRADGSLRLPNETFCIVARA
jgi:hypothetical protein